MPRVKKTDSQTPDVPVDETTPETSLDVVVVDSPMVPPCALDESPVNSKVVVVQLADGKAAVLQTPNGIQVLDPLDIARKLPLGAKISRTGPETFVASMLPDEGVPPKTYPTARLAMTNYVADFHGVSR